MQSQADQLSSASKHLKLLSSLYLSRRLRSNSANRCSTTGCRAQQASQQGVVPSGRTPPPPGSLLLLAQLCSFMENTAVLHVMDIIAATFPGGGGGSGGDQPPAFVAGEVARRLGTASQTLLGGYVEAHGRQLTIAVRRSVDSTNWLQVRLSIEYCMTQQTCKVFYSLLLTALNCTLLSSKS